MSKPTSRKRPYAIGSITGLLVVALLQFVSPAEGAAPQESFSLGAGTIFEIIVDGVSPGNQFSWVLSGPGGTFIQAERNRLFRERFTEPGDYSLQAEILGTDQATLVRRTFGIRVTPPSQQPNSLNGGSGALIEIDPPLSENGSVVLGNSRQTLLLSPLSRGTGTLRLDLDASKDSDRDGDPTNDDDAKGSFFESDGSPLRIWFPDPSERTLVLKNTSAGGETVSTIHITNESVPSSAATTSVVSTAGLIVVKDKGDGTFEFSVREGVISTTDPLLFLWDFGDGTQSLLDRPVHSYASTGSFVVSLKARDLKTTEQVLSDTATLPVTQVRSIPVSAKSSVKSPSSSSMSFSSSQQSTVPKTTAPLSLFVKILIVLLISIFLGLVSMYFAARYLAKKAGMNGEKPPPKKAGKPSPQKGPPSLEQAPPPMSVIDVSSEHEQPHEEERKEEHRPLEPKLEDLSFDESHAPSWLKQAQAEAAKTGQTVDAPPPPALQYSPPPASSPAPLSPPKEEPQTEVPSWLSAPPPVSEPPAKPEMQKEQQKEPEVPSWLKQTNSAPPPPPPSPPSQLSTTPPLPPPPPPPPEPPKETQAEPPASPTQAPQEKAAPVPESSVSPFESPEEKDEESKADEEKSLSPEERERRRKKRQRYKANRKRREQEAKQQEAKPAEAPVSPAESPKLESPPPEEKKPASSEPKASELKQPAPPPETPDETIAIIRADHLGKDEKKPGAL